MTNLTTILTGNKYLSKGKITIKESSNIAIGITAGLTRDYNEDCVGFAIHEQMKKLVIADGHWGINAAQMTVSEFLNFPNPAHEKLTGLQILREAENRIFSKFQNYSDKKLPAETSILFAEIQGNLLSLLSYGDCLAYLISPVTGIKLLNKPQRTWLGVFSHLGIQGRQSINEASEFLQLELRDKEILLLFTDGISECKTDHKLISSSNLPLLVDSVQKPEVIAEKILKMALKLGGEDNASIIVYKHTLI